MKESLQVFNKDEIDFVDNLMADESTAQRLYAVFKTGVYRHECGGVFSGYASAIDAAVRLIRQERDSYHSYNVMPLLVDCVYAESEPRDIVVIEKMGDEVLVDVEDRLKGIPTEYEVLAINKLLVEASEQAKEEQE